MRENNCTKKGLALYYIQFKIKKTLVLTALNALKIKGVKVFDVKIFDNGWAFFSVLNKDEKKVFAIFKELWYNEKVIEKTARYGFFYPIYSLFKSVGIFLGLIFFVVVSSLSSFFVTDFEFTGSGKEYKREAIKVLNDNGIYENKSVKGVDLFKVKNQILSSNSNLSFVEIKKSGFRLIVELELMTEKSVLDKTAITKLVSDCEGQVVSVKTYRGTPLVKVGDYIKAGDLLVDGYYIANEENIPCTVIASVVVLTKNKYEYFSENDNSEENALIFAEQSLGEEYFSYEIEKNKKENGYEYLVWLHFKKEISAT